MAIFQAEVDEKASAITVLRKTLGILFEQYPFLKILTGDALFAGNPLCSEIIQHGRHYLFQIKGDQRTLHEKTDLIFARHLNRAPDPAQPTGEKNGYTIGREVFVVDWKALDMPLGLPGQQQAICPRTFFVPLSEAKPPKPPEVHYYATSLPPHQADATRLARLIREHFRLSR